MLKLTPQAWVDSVPIHKFVSEDKESDSAVLKGWNKVQEKKNELQAR